MTTKETDMNEEQHWIDDITSVSERIKSPQIPAHLLERIQAIPSTIRMKVDLVPKRTIWLVAASIAALIAVNIYVSNSSVTVESSSDSFGETYFSHLNQL
ncbi:MAG: hypothetical protein HRT58_21735 [Crocinitomicaceae bacterium]|nr:hypothetical protein [Crocinitomicaceae bacterium]